MSLFLLPDFGGPAGTGASLQITLMMIAAGGTAKNLTRHRWRWREYYLGMELAFAAITSVLARMAQGTASNAADLGVFMGWSVFLLIHIVALHRVCDALDKRYVVRFFALGVLANLLGAALIFIAVVQFGG